VVGGDLVCVRGDGFDQQVGAEDVVAHRGEDEVRRVRQADWIGWLLMKALMRFPSAAGSMMPNSPACVIGHAHPCHGHAGARCEVVVDHLARIHAVDVVGAEHADRVGALVVDEVEVLVDRIGGAGRTSVGRAASGRAPA